METHGENPRKLVFAIIPARYSSVRLPGKMLLPIAGKPLILHTVERAREAATVDEVIVATDDQRIFEAVTEHGHKAVMTSPDHQSGSDRIAEVVSGLPEGSIIVNVQGDEPLISPYTIDRAVETMLQGGADIVTVCEPITSVYGELLNFNVVKVVFGDDGRAFYFSRSPMPFPRDASLRHGGDPNRAIENEPELFENFKKHTGLYVYSREYLLKFTEMPQTRLEKFESLEQLRALENGAVIKVVEAVGTSIGVDTIEDLDNVKLKIEFPEITIRQGTAADIPAISEAYVRSVRGSYAGCLPAEYLDGLSVENRVQVFTKRRGDHDSYRMLIAEDETEGVIGFIDYAHKESGNFDHDGRIFSFYFVPEFQRRGLGGLLFRKCLRGMRSECYGSVCLDTIEANPYRTFYEKMGGTFIAAETHEVNGRQFPTVVYGWDDLRKYE